MHLPGASRAAWVRLATPLPVLPPDVASWDMTRDRRPYRLDSMTAKRTGPKISSIRLHSAYTEFSSEVQIS